MRSNSILNALLSTPPPPFHSQIHPNLLSHFGKRPNPITQYQKKKSYTFSVKINFNIFTFYIKSIIFYYYSNKKNHYKTHFFTFLYKTFIPCFFTSIKSVTVLTHSIFQVPSQKQPLVALVFMLSTPCQFLLKQYNIYGYVWQWTGLE